MLQKIKKMMKGICSSERIKMLSFMLLVGTVTAFAQNAAGDYSAGTTALGTVTDEIAKYVPYVVKLCYAIAGIVAVVGAISVYIKNEQRGTGREEVYHDDCRSLYLPGSCCTGTSVVFRYLRLTAHGNPNGQQPLHGVPTVQGASTAS